MQFYQNNRIVHQTGMKMKSKPRYDYNIVNSRQIHTLCPHHKTRHTISACQSNYTFRFIISCSTFHLHRKQREIRKHNIATKTHFFTYDIIIFLNLVFIHSTITSRFPTYFDFKHLQQNENHFFPIFCFFFSRGI